jgi:hypothetical protein
VYDKGARTVYKGLEYPDNTGWADPQTSDIVVQPFQKRARLALPPGTEEEEGTRKELSKGEKELAAYESWRVGKVLQHGLMGKAILQHNLPRSNRDAVQQGVGNARGNVNLMRGRAEAAGAQAAAEEKEAAVGLGDANAAADPEVDEVVNADDLFLKDDEGPWDADQLVAEATEEQKARLAGPDVAAEEAKLDDALMEADEDVVPRSAYDTAVDDAPFDPNIGDVDDAPFDPNIGDVDDMVIDPDAAEGIDEALYKRIDEEFEEEYRRIAAQDTREGRIMQQLLAEDEALERQARLGPENSLMRELQDVGWNPEEAGVEPQGVSASAGASVEAEAAGEAAVEAPVDYSNYRSPAAEEGFYDEQKAPSGPAARDAAYDLPPDIDEAGLQDAVADVYAEQGVVAGEERPRGMFQDYFKNVREEEERLYGRQGARARANARRGINPEYSQAERDLLRQNVGEQFDAAAALGGDRPPESAISRARRAARRPDDFFDPGPGPAAPEAAPGAAPGAAPLEAAEEAKEVFTGAGVGGEAAAAAGGEAAAAAGVAGDVLLGDEMVNIGTGVSTARAAQAAYEAGNMRGMTLAQRQAYRAARMPRLYRNVVGDMAFEGEGLGYQGLFGGMGDEVVWRASEYAKDTRAYAAGQEAAAYIERSAVGRAGQAVARGVGGVARGAGGVARGAARGVAGAARNAFNAGRMSINGARIAARTAVQRSTFSLGEYAVATGINEGMSAAEIAAAANEMLRVGWAGAGAAAAEDAAVVAGEEIAAGVAEEAALTLGGYTLGEIGYGAGAILLGPVADVAALALGAYFVGDMIYDLVSSGDQRAPRASRALGHLRQDGDGSTKRAAVLRLHDARVGPTGSGVRRCDCVHRYACRRATSTDARQRYASADTMAVRRS